MTSYQLGRCLIRRHAHRGSHMFIRYTVSQQRCMHTNPLLLKDGRYHPLKYSAQNHCWNANHLTKVLNSNWSLQTHRMLHSLTYGCHQQLQNAMPDVKSSNGKAHAHVAHTLHETVLDVMGARYRVGYVDEGDKNDPIILCLHGSPASYKDFLPMMPSLVSNGARVILFNFPGIGYSWHLEGSPFDYSHLSKAKLVEAFLSHQGIDKVNMLVSHCASGHAGMQLCANTDLIQGVSFISPLAHLPHRTSDHTFTINFVYHSLKHPYMRALLGPLELQVWSKISKVPLNIQEVDYFYGLACEARQWDWKQAEADLKDINTKGMPVMVLAAQRDPVVQFYILKGMMDLLGISQESRLTYSEDHSGHQNEIEHINPLKHGVIFEKGHWIQKSHPKVVAGLIMNFLNAIQDCK
ncbi:uncharacterized protein [Amphiura filiformis]|uniref:uncharacterized protein n=1 Tax=Amphiura filiformis TaxID=82378 RepID=UPI003B2223C7